MTKEKDEFMNEAENNEANEKQELLEQKDAEFKNSSKANKAPQKRWYVVHTYSGHENKVKVNLEKRVEYMNMGEKIFRIEVPQKTITKVKDGKKQDREVTKFVGSAKKPIPAKDSEIKKIIHRSQTQSVKIELDVKVGDKVRIVSGPFADFIGDITEVYPDKSKLRASVSIFGRETPVELEYKQIQKV